VVITYPRTWNVDEPRIQAPLVLASSIALVAGPFVTVGALFGKAQQGFLYGLCLFFALLIVFLFG
jgi:hypothetical protein